MWGKKTVQELKRELFRQWLGHALFALTITCLVCLAAYPQGDVKFPIGGQVLAVLTAGVLLMEWHRRAHRRHLKVAMGVCDKCNMIKENDGLWACACGGTWTILPEMRWLDFPPRQPDHLPDLLLKSEISLALAASMPCDVGVALVDHTHSQVKQV
jgi:hypothetical protein